MLNGSQWIHLIWRLGVDVKCELCGVEIDCPEPVDFYHHFINQHNFKEGERVEIIKDDVNYQLLMFRNSILSGVVKSRFGRIK